ncbi:hypothetical protein D3C71_2043030 [compost metagenome]
MLPGSFQLSGDVLGLHQIMHIQEFNLVDVALVNCRSALTNGVSQFLRDFRQVTGH